MSSSKPRGSGLSDEAFDNAIRSIGMRVGSGTHQGEPADIERTLLAVPEFAAPTDYRVLSVFVTGLGEHGRYVNVPRLRRLLRERAPEELERAMWSAIGRWLKPKEAHWQALERLYRGPAMDLEGESTALQLARIGPDPRYKDSLLRVSSKLLRDRASDVATPEELAARHVPYARRIEMGATDRTDVWVALQENPELTDEELAARVGCSATFAGAVAKDFRLLLRAAVLR